MISLSPDQEDELLERTARILADRAEAAAGGIMELVVVPMATVTLMTSLSRATVPTKMAVTKSGGKDGVTMAEIKRYLKERTAEPLKRKRKGGGV